MNSNSTIIDVEQTDFQKHLLTLSEQTDIT